MLPYLRVGLPVVLLAALVGCAPDYSPNTYSTAAVQQANKVDQGVIAGFREVAVRADGTVGAVTGGAAGGVLGAQTPDGGVVTALSTIGGTFIGGLVGSTVERAADDTTAFEYLVRKSNGDLLSVTQKDVKPLAVGLKVLVIEGRQARVVPDYSVPVEASTPSSSGVTAKNDKKNGETSDKAASSDRAGKVEKDATANGAASGAPNDTAPTPAQAAPPTATPAAPPAPADAAESAPTQAPATAPAEAPQPASVETQPSPATGSAQNTPAAPSAAPQPPDTPTPQTTTASSPGTQQPAPTAASMPTQDAQGEATSSPTTQAPPPAEAAPTPTGVEPNRQP